MKKLNKWPREGKEATERQKQWRDQKRAEGWVHLSTWVKIERKAEAKRYIKYLNEQ